MANNDKENKIKKFTKEAIGKTLNQFNKEIGMADLVEINKNQDRILNGILSQVNDENTEKAEKSNIITLDNSTDGIVELKEIQGDTNVNVSKIEEMPITHDIGDKEGNVFTLNEIPKGAISIGEIQGNTMVNCNKDDKKELVLMKDLSTQGDNNITLTEGVDGGKVDVALEGNTLVNVSKTKNNYITHEREEDTTGNHIALADEGYIRPMLTGKTMVNVCDQKDPVAITKSYTVENSGNHVALQGEYDGKCRPVLNGNTLVNLRRVNNCNLNISDTSLCEVTSTSNKASGTIHSAPDWMYLNMGSLKENTLFKPDTKYTIIFKEAVKVTEVALMRGDGSRMYSNQAPIINNKAIITTKSNINDYVLDAMDCIYVFFDNSSYPINFSCEIICVLEGDYTDRPIPDYFEGLQSSFEDRLVSERLAHFPSTILTTPSSGYTYREFGDTLSLKPSTTYTIVQKAHKTTNHSPVNTNAHPYTLVFGGRQGVSDSWIVRANPPVGDIKEGVSVYTLTTPNDFVISTQTFIVIVEENRGSEFELEVSIFEGDYTNYNFSDYDPTKAGKYRVDYKVTGKNKFNINTTTIIGLISSDGSIQSANDWRIHDYMDIKPNTEYTLSEDSDNYKQFYVAIYDKDKNFVSKFILEGGSTLTFTTPSNSYFYRMGYSVKVLNNAVNRERTQLEQGDTATEYEPYKESTKTLYLNSPLLEGDTIEQYGNDIVHVHRYGKAVLNGGEAWKASSINDRFPGQYLCYLVYPNVSFVHDTEMSPMMCDKFKVVSPGDTNLSNVSPDSISVSGVESNLSEKAFRLSISESKLSSLDLAGFRKYLLTNPVTVVYKLVSPTYEVISTNDELITGSYVNGHLDFESAVPVDKVVFQNLYLPLKYQYSNTRYTIQFESDNPGKIYVMYSSGANISNQDVVKGINKFNFTTNASPYPNLLINGIGFNASNIVVTPAIEQDFDYFSGLSSTFEDGLVTQEMVDSGEEEVGNLGKYKVEYKVTGKNKFNPMVLKDCPIASIDGDNVILNGSLTYHWWYKITLPKGSYTPSGNDVDIRLHMFYNGGDNGFTTSKTFTYDSEVTLQGYISSGTYDNYILSNLQIEEGDTATSYEPYKESTKTLYLNSPLLEGDTIEEKDGGIYHVHRRSKVVLDGNSTIRKETDGNNVYRFITPIGDIEQSYITPLYSDNFKSNSTCLGVDYEVIASSNTHIYFGISKNRLLDNTVGNFKQWLQQNPTTIVYELLTPQYELIEQFNLAIPSYTNGRLDLPSAVPVEKVKFKPFEEELTYLYPATSYTVQFTSDKAITVDITLGGTSLLAQNITKGLNRMSITTPETLVNNKLIIDGVGAKINNVVVTNTDRKFGYFEGMKSVGECEGLEVKSSNKNLFDFDTFFSTTEGFTVTRGIFTVDTNNKTLRIQNTNMRDCHTGGIFTTIGEQLNDANKHKAIRVEPDTHYCFTANISGGGICNVYVAEHDSDYKLLRFASFSASSTLCSAPLYTTTNTKYVVLRFSCLEVGTEITVSNIQFEEGSTATEYIPHKSNSQILNHEPLRAVGDTKDRYVLLDGKWYIERRCEEVVFDGSADYGFSGSNDVSKIISLEVSNKAYGQLNVKSDKLPTIYGGDVDYDKKCIFGQGGRRYIHIRLRIDESGDNSQSIKQWLQANPITAVYQLETPIYEEIDYNPLEVYADVTHITTNSAIPTSIAIKNTGFNCLLKPSTTYTVSSNLGINTVTTGADIGDSCLRFYNDDTSTKTTMRNVLILEGDWTSKADLIPCNFSGIESAFEQVLVTDKNDVNYGKYRVTAKVIGKNLFNKDNIIANKYHNCNIPTQNFNISSNSNYSISELIPIRPNTTYIIQGITDPYHAYYDINKKVITNKATFNKCFTTPSNAYYIVLNIHNTNDNVNNVQLEQGDVLTVYEPYKESDVTFYIDEPLRGIGDSKDRVYIEDDKVIVQRNCKEEVFNETNTMGLVSTSDKIYRYALKSANKYKRGSIALSDKFPSDITNADFEHIRYDTNIPYSTSLQLYINKNKLTSSSELRNYLQSNPITVLGILAEPVYEEVEYSSNRLILNTFNNESFNNSTLFLDTNISPKLSFKPLYEELVYIKNSTKYYIQFNAVGSGVVVINLGGTELTTEIVEGYNCIPITTPSESTNLMTIIGQGITISEVVVSEVICGGYYKGLQSCFEEHMENGKYRILLRGIALDGSKVNGIKLYINEPLRGVNDTKDRLCIKNGKLMVERKCSSIIFDGSNDEKITIHPKREDGFTSFLLNVPEVSSIDTKFTDVICDILPSNSKKIYDSCTMPNIYKWVDASADFVGVLEGNNVNVRQWLQQNPATIVYQLAEPVYEEATNEYGLPIVFEGYENGIVYIDSAVTPTTHIKYTSNNQLATTLSEAEEQNISTQEDINMNVITYMMDIDMMLTDMEMSNDISVMAVRRDSSNENMLDRMSDEDKKVYRDNTVVMLEKMITAKALEKEDIERRIDMYYDKNRISKEQYKYLKSLL